eukprot:12938736-Prorocentrum_lima.AAC.1
MTQGEELWALMKAGGTITVRGPGEDAEIRCPRPCWLHISRSSQERARPSTLGAQAAVVIDLRGLHGE